jgi:hypothetical protein
LGVNGYRGEKHNYHSCDKQGISRFHFVLLHPAGQQPVQHRLLAGESAVPFIPERG